MSGAPLPATGHITPRVSWPRPATPTDMVPAWAGEFRDFDDWVSKATTRLTGTYDPLMGDEIPAICIDAIGRRCTTGGHFMRARDEGTFPVRFFWDFVAPKPVDPVEDFLAEVRVELINARTKFPGDRIMTIALAEEFGELCKAVLDESADRVRKEAVQTAVMAARIVLDGDGSVTGWRAERGLDPLIPLRHACCGQHPEDGHAPGCGT